MFELILSMYYVFKRLTDISEGAWAPQVHVPRRRDIGSLKMTGPQAVSYHRMRDKELAPEGQSIHCFLP